MEKYTSNGLPVVSKETIEKFVNGYMIKDNRARESEKALSLENPILGGFLYEVVQKQIAHRIEEARGYAGGFIAAYTLLNIQAEEYKK